MDQQPIQGGHADNEPDNKTEQKKIEWRHVLDWGFWTGHPLATFSLFIGGILLASITSFPGGNPKVLWFFASGLWLIIGVIIWWVFAGIIARMEGRELLTAQEIEDRDQEYKKGIQSQFDSIKLDVGETKKQLGEARTDITDTRRQLAEQRPRRLTAIQREAITKAISPYRGKSMMCMCSLADAESCSFATEILTVFADAGWTTDGIHGSFMTPEIGSACLGINTEVTDLELLARPEALAVLNVLHQVGLSKNITTLIRAKSTPKDSIAICIAKKPLAEIQAEPSAGTQPAPSQD